MQWLRTKAQLSQKMLCALECLSRAGKPFILGCFRDTSDGLMPRQKPEFCFSSSKGQKAWINHWYRSWKPWGVCSFSNLKQSGFQGALVSSHTHFKNNKEKNQLFQYKLLLQLCIVLQLFIHLSCFYQVRMTNVLLWCTFLRNVANWGCFHSSSMDV